MRYCQRCGRKIEEIVNIRIGCGTDENLFLDRGVIGKTFHDLRLHQMNVCDECRGAFIDCVLAWYQSAPKVQGEHKNCLCDTCQIHAPDTAS